MKFITATLDNNDRPAILAHLKRLDTNDRYLRFFAAVGDYMLEDYVNKIDLSSQKGFGFFSPDRKNLIAFVHISGHEKSDSDGKAELGISIDKEYRKIGLAKRLMDRVVIFCKSHDINTLYMSCLRDNKAMQALAKKTGMRVVLDHSEALAELQLAEYPMQKAASISHEMMYEQIAIVDKCYRFNTHMVNVLLGRG